MLEHRWCALCLQTFESSTRPMMTQLHTLGKLVQVDASGTAEEVYARVREHFMHRRDRASVHSS